MRLALLALAACSTLPHIDANVCGNGIVEVGEDCDGTSDGATCGAADGVNACHLVFGSGAGLFTFLGGGSTFAPHLYSAPIGVNVQGPIVLAVAQAQPFTTSVVVAAGTTISYGGAGTPLCLDGTIPNPTCTCST